MIFATMILAAITSQTGTISSDTRCGQYSFFVLSSMYVDDLRMADIEAIAPPRGTGSTFADLQKLARHYNFHSYSLKLTPEELLAIGVPAILHLDQGEGEPGGHFVAAVPVGPRRIQVVDPPDPPRLESDAWLAAPISGWTGNVMLMSRVPLRMKLFAVYLARPVPFFSASVLGASALALPFAFLRFPRYQYAYSLLLGFAGVVLQFL